MARSLRSLFARQLDVQSRLHRFVTALEQRILGNGMWQISPAQPTITPYTFKDPDTDEMIRLWRTPEDVARQAEYQTYRLILKTGVKSVMDPDLFVSRRKDQRPEVVRSYNLLRMISRALTALVSGSGIQIETGIEPIDELVKEHRLASDVRKWQFEASVYGMVGIEVDYSPELDALSVVRVMPDHLYPVRDSINTDQILYIAKKTRIPIEQYPEWVPLTLESDANVGVKRRARGRTLKRHGPETAVKSGEPLEQDGFVFEERHYPGWIEYYFYATVDDRIIADVPLSVYSPEVARSPVVLTGMRSHAIQILGNTTEEGDWVSDWRDLVDPVVEFCTRATKNGRLVDRFSAPRELVPQTSVSVDPFTGKVNYRTGPDDVVVIRPTDKVKPEFIQPNADFSGPNDDLLFLRSMIGILSEMGHIIDPALKERLTTGVALKLHMAPAMAKVAPRAEEQSDVIRQVMFNVLGAIEYYTSEPTAKGTLSPESTVAKLEAEYSGLLRGELAKKTDLAKEAQLRSGNRFAMDELEPVFQHITLTDSLNISPSADGRVRAITFANPTEAMVVNNALMQPGQVVGQNTIGPSPFPDVWTGDNILQHEQALAAAEAVIAMDDIIVRFSPGLPQDETEAAQRVSDGTMSLKWFLVDFDNMTDEEAEQEMQAIANGQNAGVGVDGEAGAGRAGDAYTEPSDEADEYGRLSAIMELGQSGGVPLNPLSDQVGGASVPAAPPISS